MIKVLFLIEDGPFEYDNRVRREAATLIDAVSFYDTRFDLHLSQQDKDDLVSFLRTL